ncbi:MAG TPA: hypothetical protein VN496_03855 [Burkholderiales bacterium]|nr:hypothetical protein [Burkholderiales bacterium]
MTRSFLFVICLALSSLGYAAPAPDTEANRLEAANQLFKLPAYRMVATRQLYESLKTLPAEQHKRALAALSDADVMASLRGIISRSMAQTFTTAELEHLAHFFEAREALTMVNKAQNFQSALDEEVRAASITDPQLIKILIGK